MIEQDPGFSYIGPGGYYLFPNSPNGKPLPLTAFKQTCSPFPQNGTDSKSMPWRLVVGLAIHYPYEMASYVGSQAVETVSKIPDITRGAVQNIKRNPIRSLVLAGSAVLAAFGGATAYNLLSHHTIAHAEPLVTDIGPSFSPSFNLSPNHQGNLPFFQNQPPSIKTVWEVQGVWNDPPRYGWTLQVHFADPDGPGVKRWYLDAVKGSGGTAGHWGFTREPVPEIDFGMGFFNNDPCIQAYVAVEDALGVRNAMFTPVNCIEENPQPSVSPTPKLPNPVLTPEPPILQPKLGHSYNVHVPWAIAEDHILYFDNEGNLIDEDVVSEENLWYGASGVRSPWVNIQVRRSFGRTWQTVRSGKVYRMLNYKDISISYQDASWPFSDPKTDPPRR